MANIDDLHQQILAGNRRALSKAITLLESSLSEDQRQAEILLTMLMRDPRDSIRIGISGPPGVGKSTFIEAFGQSLLNDGKSIAILAIDPSSPVSGGSILADRTRMEVLSRHEKVFIRPTPAGRTLGGVARHTREAILACEKAGYGYILIETVGVGQSEFSAASMVDVFLMLHQPYSGDELQGIKRGILELADVVAITKADGESLAGAQIAHHQLQQAMLTGRGTESWLPPVILTSAISQKGIAEVKSQVMNFLSKQKTSGDFSRKRQEQARKWLHDELNAQLLEALQTNRDLSRRLQLLENEVISDKLTGSAAARSIISEIFSSTNVLLRA